MPPLPPSLTGEGRVGANGRDVLSARFARAPIPAFPRERGKELKARSSPFRQVGKELKAQQDDDRQ